MRHPTEKRAHTKSSVIPVVEYWLERENDQWVHHDVADWFIDRSNACFVWVITFNVVTIEIY